MADRWPSLQGLCLGQESPFDLVTAELEQAPRGLVTLKGRRGGSVTALGIREEIAPQSLDVAGSLANLGVTALHRGDLPAAEDYSRRALIILDRIAPGSLDVAKGLNNLGRIPLDRGDMAAAEGAAFQLVGDWR